MQTVNDFFQAEAGKPSAVRAMFEKGLELKAKYGADAICDFSLGNPDVPPPEATRAILHEIADTCVRPLGLGYCPNAGMPKVREAIAAYITHQQGMTVSAKDVIMTVGAAGALVDFFRATLAAGDEVIVPSPYFLEYGYYCGNFGGILKPVPTRRDFSLDVSAIMAAVTPKTRAIIINSPNNPTGNIYTRGELEELVKAVEEYNSKDGGDPRTPFRPIFILSDEPYRAFAYDGAEVPAVLPMSKWCVLMGSFSKTLSMAGERLGYLVVHPELTKLDNGVLLASLIRANGTLGFVNAPVIGQQIAARICNSTVDLAIYKRRRDLMAEILSEAGIRFQMPKGAFYFFPETPGGDDAKWEQALLEEKILVVPGKGFGREGHFRLSCSVDEKIIARSREGFKRAAARV